MLLITEEGEDMRSSFARTARVTEGRRSAVLGWAAVGALLAASGFYLVAVGAALTVPIGVAVTTCAWTALLADR